MFATFSIFVFHYLFWNAIAGPLTPTLIYGSGSNADTFYRVAPTFFDIVETLPTLRGVEFSKLLQTINKKLFNFIN